MNNTVPAIAGRLAGTAVRRIRQVDWEAVAERTLEYALIAWAILQTLAAIGVLTAEIIWENREEIQDRAYAAVEVAVEVSITVYQAGKSFRTWLEQLSKEVANAAANVPAVLAPVAPIVGPIYVAIAEARKDFRLVA